MRHRNMLKRFLALLSALTVSLAIIPATVLAEETKPEVNISFADQSISDVAENNENTITVYIVKMEDGTYELIRGDEVIPYAIGEIYAKAAVTFRQLTTESARLDWTVTMLDTYGYNLKKIRMDLICRSSTSSTIYLDQTVTADGEGKRRVLSGQSRTFNFPGEERTILFGWTDGTFTTNAENQERWLGSAVFEWSLY